MKEKLDTVSATDRKMLIGLHLGNGYGSQSGAWRMPWVDRQQSVTVVIPMRSSTFQD
ncbi:hypothetical protein B0I27_101471 [Arcticibacter pallidicorallinus]|uniref:Uncharacterized protein n=1 Tax=Arcticibacter pallidicorallinus TaxID=1259464 RepID=A0A2T0UC57_9SPHI|nr:hypothetical protein B0I27_101471 [Arcticibacter pallidicorallinus]